MTSANAGEGENQLHAELDCDSDVSGESVKDRWVTQRRVQVLLAVFLSSREPQNIMYEPRDGVPGISSIKRKSDCQSE